MSVAESYPMISIAVAALDVGILTISPDTYFALPDGAVVTALVWVVFFVPESFVQPVNRTQEIRSNTRLDTMIFFLFIVLNEQGDYFKKSFYSHFCFNTKGLVWMQGFLIVQEEKEKESWKNTKKQE
jgi:hypothetical protein